MNSINNTNGLWTNLTTEEIDAEKYGFSCCFNVKITKAPGERPVKAEAKDK